MHVDLITKDDLKILMKEQNRLCVSIFMPTHRTAKETQQDRIRLKNLLTEAEKTLISVDPSQVNLLKPAQNLFQESPFWWYQSDGLALFLSSGVFFYYRVPLNFSELVVVIDRFHLKPLLPLFSGDGRFHILAVSQNEVRVFQCTRHSISELHPASMPESAAEALRYDDPEKQLQFHTGTSAGRGKRPAMFHGQGVGTDDTKENTLRYFRQIDKGIRKFLHDEEVPLVFAGVDYLFPIYRKANNYPNLLSEGISGNPEMLGAKDLHERAWSIVEPYFQEARNEAAAQYIQFAGTGRTSCDLKSIVPAAYRGRVEIVFVALGSQRWGTFDQNNQTTELHDIAEPGDQDLLDFAAIQTLINGGSVYAVEQDKMPTDSSVAAFFRY
ncbi:MAG: hypothetical protein PVF48_11530 [Syntrophobacterales bacterium]